MLFAYFINGKIMFTQKAESGITKIIEGIISAIGNIFRRSILKPVATIKNPPQALKSAIILGVENGIMKRASKNSR